MPWSGLTPDPDCKIQIQWRKMFPTKLQANINKWVSLQQMLSMLKLWVQGGGVAMVGNDPDPQWLFCVVCMRMRNIDQTNQAEPSLSHVTPSLLPRAWCLASFIDIK